MLRVILAKNSSKLIKTEKFYQVDILFHGRRNDLQSVAIETFYDAEILSLIFLFAKFIKDACYLSEKPVNFSRQWFYRFDKSINCWVCYWPKYQWVLTEESGDGWPQSLVASLRV